MPYGDNGLLRDGLRQLQLRLPQGWTVGESSGTSPTMSHPGVRILAPDSHSSPLSIDVCPRLDPKAAISMIAAHRGPEGAPRLVISRYLSASVRERLRAANVGYLDLSGNIRLAISSPGLYIETQGSTEDPDREERVARSLRGAKAGRIVRALIDFKDLPGVRQIAARAHVDAGYVSRVLSFLDTEALIARDQRGRLIRVDWPALLRRWALEVPFVESRGSMVRCLEPRGLPNLLKRLSQSDEEYVVTGSLAAAHYPTVAPARLGAVYVRDAQAAADRLGLREVEAGNNVLLIEPNDAGVFEGKLVKDGVWYAATSQVAADLMTSPGRGPAEGDALIGWMIANEEVWRG